MKEGGKVQKKCGGKKGKTEKTKTGKKVLVFFYHRFFFGFFDFFFLTKNFFLLVWRDLKKNHPFFKIPQILRLSFSKKEDDSFTKNDFIKIKENKKKVCGGGNFFQLIRVWNCNGGIF